VKLDRNPAGLAGADIGNGMSGAGRHPLHVSGFERDVCGFFAGRSISQGKIGYGDDQMGTGVSMSGEDSGRLKFDVRDAGTVFYEEYMLRAVLQDLQAAIFVPFRRAGFTHQFNRHIAKWGKRQVAGDMGKAAGSELDFAILKFDSNWRPSCDVVFNFSGPYDDKQVIMAMPMHKGRVIGRDFDLENPHICVLKGEVMMRLGGDFNVLVRLRGQTD